MSGDAAMPLVSIVTPSLNQAQYLRQCLDSVASQTYERIEHIVIDGGSTDGTLELLQEYGERLLWVSEPDEGQSDALNKGFSLSHGDILAWLNSDDFYLPGAVEHAVRFLAQNPDVAMVYGDCILVDAEGQQIELQRPPDFDLEWLLEYGNYIPQQATFRPLQPAPGCLRWDSMKGTASTRSPLFEETPTLSLVPESRVGPIAACAASPHSRRSSVLDSVGVPSRPASIRSVMLMRTP